MDLRCEIIKLFESVITMFLLERDVSDDQVEMNVIKEDGSIVKEKLKFFDALNNAFATSQCSTVSKALFGEWPVTATLRASLENWNIFTDVIDKQV